MYKLTMPNKYTVVFMLENNPFHYKYPRTNSNNPFTGEFPLVTYATVSTVALRTQSVLHIPVEVYTA